MVRLPILVFAGLAGISAAAMAQQAPSATQRLRGTVISIKDDTATIRSGAGEDVQVMIGADTKFASVTPAQLADVKSGEFIGTAAKGPVDNLVALEVVIFPESMRGTGEGHYPWDKLPDTTAAGGQRSAAAAPQVQSSMTNGTVTTASSKGAVPMVASSMTNGSITADAARPGGKELTVQYKGQKAQVLVPPDVPIVRVAPAERSVLATGAKVFVRATPLNDGRLKADSVVVGQQGATPPM